MNAYNQDPEVKRKNLLRRKLYIEKNKDKIDAYRQRPEVKEQERLRLEIYGKSDVAKEYDKKYNQRPDVKEMKRLSAKKNYPNRKAYIKKYRAENKIKISEVKKEYDRKNSVLIKEQKRLYTANKRRTDVLFKLRENSNSLIRKAIQRKNLNKSNKTTEILGCSIPEFKQHLESKFESWMTWDNYGLYNNTEGYGWDIDHITPMKTAKTEDEVIKLNHYTNLQPLCSYINRVTKRLVI